MIKPPTRGIRDASGTQPGDPTDLILTAVDELVQELRGMQGAIPDLVRTELRRSMHRPLTELSSGLRRLELAAWAVAGAIILFSAVQVWR